jgi:hypothetical protein
MAVKWDQSLKWQNDLKAGRREAAVVQFKTYYGVLLPGLRKYIKDPSQDNGCPGWDSITYMFGEQWIGNDVECMAN